MISLLLLVVRKMLIVHTDKISARIDHELHSARLEVIGEMREEIIRLKGEISVVSYVGKRLHYRIPIHMLKEGKRVHITAVIVIVNVQSLKTIVSENADSVLSLLADKSAMTKIKTSHEMLVVKRIDIAYKLGRP